MLDFLLYNWRGRIVRYAPVIFWTGVIFYLSSDKGAMAETSRFVRPILEFLFPSAPEEMLHVYHGYLRKAAHFSEYAVLALLTFRALNSSSRESLRGLRFILPLTLAAGIAAIDELHQSFLSSRTGSVWDIVLDISGGAVMVLLIWVYFWRRTDKSC